MDKFAQFKQMLSLIDWQNCILFCTDSYKWSHYAQYPVGTTKIYSYVEARRPNKDLNADFVVAMGAQRFINQYLTRPVTMDHVEAAKLFAELHGVPFFYDGWKAIVEKHNGFLPIEIKAVSEGSIVPVKNVLCTITNTDDEFPWIVNFVETALLRSMWYQTTVATYSHLCKKTILDYLTLTSNLNDTPNADFNLHDFGARGVSSGGSAMAGGSAHIASFSGSDTIEGILATIEDFDPIEMPAFSVPAAEHSTVTIYGRDGERDAMRNMIAQFQDKFNIISFVADSYNLWENIEVVCKELKDDIIEAGIKYVIRPDSGDPVNTLRRLFITLRGYNVLVLNGKGYYELPDWLGVLQGDGIEYLTITAILKMLAQEGFSTKGLVLGMGGKLLQSHSRDDFGFAMKCSYAIVDGKPVNVFKDPITDPGKRSKMGRLKLVRFKGNLSTVSDAEDGNWDSYVDELQVKYSKINHQVVVNKDTFESVRQRIANNI